MNSNRFDHLKWKYLAVMALFFLIVVVFRIYYDVKHHEQMLDDKIRELFQDVDATMQNSIEDLQKKYSAISRLYATKPYFNELVVNRERQFLQDYLSKDYLQLKQLDPDLYVMHLFDTRNTTILRMHKPQSYDDDLSAIRPMVAATNRDHQLRHSFEIGKNGISYRIATPIVTPENRHIGVLEFGVEPSYFVRQIAQRFDVKSEILIRTDAMQSLSYTTEYIRLGDYSIISRDPFFAKISKKVGPQQMMEGEAFLAKVDGNDYIVLNHLDLSDIQGRTVAKIIIAKDITAFIQSNQRSLNLINGVNSAMFVLILALLYFVFTRYTTSLHQTDRQATAWHKRSLHYQTKSETDELTGVYNRAYFNRNIEAFFKTEPPTSMILIDIDYFKQINDTYGHLAGDHVLVELSNLFKTFFRHHDTIVRWGGEEFVVVMEDTSSAQACEKADQLRERVKKIVFREDISLTFSCGIAQIEPGEFSNAFFKRLDALLYEAKEKGRNRTVCDIASDHY